MVSLALAGLAFLLLHVGVAGSRMRDALVSRLGERGFGALFSLASIAAMVWLVIAYRAAPWQPVWLPAPWSALLADIAMLPAFVLVIAGLATPNPTAMGQERLASQAPSGIVRVTRHPFLMGVALWASVHLLANGDVASLLFFGSLLAVCLAGAPSIDAKRRRRLGSEGWSPFAAQTSILPFAAILTGRTRLSVREIGAWRLLLGVLAYALFIGGHRHIIGVSPFPS